MLKHKNILIIYKLLILIVGVFFIIQFYPCLNSNGEESCLLYGPFYLFAVILVLAFIFLFSFENWKKLVYYFVEFLIVVFGIYSLVIIQKALELGFLTELFRVLNLLIVFVVLTILFDLRKTISDVLERG